MSLDYPDIELDQLPDLLDRLDPDLPYKEWSKIGRALYVEFGENAFDPFDSWSSTGSTYQAKQVRGFWKNFRKTSKVAFGSFIAELKKAGWKGEKRQLSEVDKAERQAKKQQRITKQKSERAKQAIAQLQALSRSQQAFNRLQPYSEPSAYFLNKHMHDAHKLIELRQGFDKFNQHFIAWPIWSELGNKGQFCGFERILDKKINWHNKWLNKFSSEDANTDTGFATFGNIDDLSNIKRIFVVGGFADAYAAHVTTGDIIVTPIGEGNIANIVNRLQKAHPQLQIIAGPDNDKQGQYTVKACDGPWTLPIKAGADWSDVWLQEGTDALKNQLFNVRGFTHVKSNQRYLTAQIKTGLNLLKSGMGTGKSETVKRYIAQNPHQSVLVISHRKSLANDLKSGINEFIAHQNTTETEQANEIQYYEDLILKNPGQGINENTPLRSAQRLVISIDSLWRLAGSHFDIIFVDEIEQGLGHFFAETNRHAEHCFNMFRFFMTHSHTQILADAHLGLLTKDFCTDNQLHSGIFYENSYQVGQGRTLYLYDNKNQLTEYYHQQILASEKVYVYSNSKAEIKTLATSVRQHIERNHCQPNLLEVHADSVKTDSQTIAAIRNIAHAVPNIDTLLASPTLGTGFDIPAYKVNPETGKATGHQFGQTFGILNSHVGTAEEGHQGINRARDINEYHLYIDPTERNEPINADYIYDNLIENVSSETAALLKIDPKTGDWSTENQAYERLYAKVKARQNLSKNAYKRRFIELARLDGYKIIEVAKNEIACEFGKMTRDEARERNQRQNLRDTNTAKLHLDHADDIIKGIPIDDITDNSEHPSVDKTYDAMNRNHDQYTHIEINKSKVCKSLNLLAANKDDIDALYPIAQSVYSEFSRPGPNAKFNHDADKAVPMPNNKHQAIVNALAFLQDTQRYSSQITKLSLLSLSDSDAKQLDLNNIKNAQSRVKWEHRSIKKRHLTKLLSIAGINEHLEYNGTTWTKEQLKQQLLDWITVNEDNLYKYSKIKLSNAAKIDPVQWFNNHLRGYGIPVESLGQARNQGGRARRYGLNQSLWRQTQVLARLRNQGIAQHLATSEQADALTNIRVAPQSITNAASPLSVTPQPTVSNNQSGQGVTAASPIATGFTPALAPHFPPHCNNGSEKRANALLNGSSMLKNDLKEGQERKETEQKKAPLTGIAKTLANLIDIAVNQVKLPLNYVQEQLTKQRQYWQQALADPLISLQQWAMTLKELYLYDCQPSGAEAARLEAFCFD